ncbi:MAG TPA: flagellar type III secretion system pore protein FliP [Fimbriimonadaceae bacterium]|nr:flagellar type III secretion system pore protein FliP [Fimbriimonadaceae bacterium]
MKPTTLLRLTVLMLLLGVGAAAFAQQSLPVPNVSIQFGSGGAPAKGANDVSSSLQILALLTVLSLAPAILILTTAFSRIIIIFSFVRQAIGTPTIPPNQVLVGLSLFLTFFIMGPTYQKINDNALQPYLQKKISQEQALKAAEAPIREFMLKNTYEKDLTLFMNLRKEKAATAQDVSLSTLIPAFIISELKTAFIIGFYIFIPFIIIDLIVASALMSMGMMMMPPVVVALPAKLLVFVLADGWGTLVSAIISGYR